jgi:hypothetical protein
MKPVSEYHFQNFRKFEKNQPFEFSSPILVGMFLSSRTVESCKCFIVESGVTPKYDTDFQNTPNRKVFRLRKVKLDFSAAPDKD